MRALAWFLLWSIAKLSFSLPPGFVYLQNIAPDIKQDMRYATNNNFVGRPIAGYQSGVCILTKPAAVALRKAQKLAKKMGYSLKVYDCYRPKWAVDDFYHWSQNHLSNAYQPAFYPRVRKNQLFQKGYIARYSGHSRGSTVDLTLILANEPKHQPHLRAIKRCYDSTLAYLNDNSINMGTRFDCLDPSAHFHYARQSKEQLSNRKRLRKIMRQAGFKPYHKEWWHFTLINEPYPGQYFDFLVR
ncbi:M15 family metallopeptidase [Legionella sp. W05-934-2]|jgi:D-alanyl-D-alanine dipeptidase|uniref:M15 family metallopeptidase n=1 Tax=Legionella sp. W05-934-2 TaxID=1198649 RepID=UPI00346231C7